MHLPDGGARCLAKLVFNMRFDSNRCEHLAREVVSKYHAGEVPQIDLSRARFITLAGLSKLVALLYTIYDLRQRVPGPIPVLRPPLEKAPAEFIIRCGFFSLVAILAEEIFIGADDWAKVETDYAARLDRLPRSSSYPAMRFRRVLEGGSETSELAFEREMSGFLNEIRSVFPAALAHLGYDADEVRVFLALNSEIYRNIFHHSEAWGYVAIQCDRLGMTICYGDVGVGFRRSLESQRDRIVQTVRRPWNDSTAILGSFEEGVSSRSEGRPISGMGLPTVRKMVMERYGVIECRSGAGRGLFLGDGSQTGITKMRDAEALIGAQISVFLPVRS